MVNSRDKGARAESTMKEALIKYTNLNWQRTPGSGALSPEHKLKGDLYIPDEKNVYCVECKHYSDDHLTSEILTSKSPILLQWWDQALRQAGQVNRKPLLLFKFDRSKIFVAYADVPFNTKAILILDKFFVSILEEWIKAESPEFIIT